METESTREPLGLLKVLVIQGKKLVIRGFKSSDPYAIVKLGNQVISRSTFFYCVECCPHGAFLVEAWSFQGSKICSLGSLKSKTHELSLLVKSFVVSSGPWDGHGCPQTAKTKVINSCLNPVWNEELSFSLTQPVNDLSLTLEVFDKDRFKSDDKMGHAELSLKPIVSAARLRRVLGVSLGVTMLRRVTPDINNCLARDSSISCTDGGDVTQSVWMKLRDVESGEIELKIKFIDHPGRSSR